MGSSGQQSQAESTTFRHAPQRHRRMGRAAVGSSGQGSRQLSDTPTTTTTVWDAFRAKIARVTIAGQLDFLPSKAFPYSACSQRGVLAIFVRAASTCDALEKARALQVCRLCPARPECNRAAAGVPRERLRTLGIVGGQDYTQFSRTVPIGTIPPVTDVL